MRRVAATISGVTGGLLALFPTAAAVLLLSAIPASAATQYTYAPVIETVPVYEMVRVASPRENCWTERVVSRQHARSASNTPVILSTIIGGALGNAVGHGKSNRRLGTVVGAVLGHSVGRDIVRNSGPVVERYEDAVPYEGGHGVTVAYLRQ